MTAAPPLLLVAHGSRSPEAARVVRGLAAAARARVPDLDVRVCFVDVHPPTVGASVATLVADGYPRAVVLPAFLSAGYHVRRDLPARLAEAGAPAHRFPVTAALGTAPGPDARPDPHVVRAAHERLVEAGYRTGDALVLAAAGSSDPRALDQVRRAATALGVLAGRRVRVGFAATGVPDVASLVEGLHRAGERRVAVASWLLAPGVFQARLHATDASVVAAPLGVHPGVVDAVLERYHGAVRDLVHAA